MSWIMVVDERYLKKIFRDDKRAIEICRHQ